MSFKAIISFNFKLYVTTIVKLSTKSLSPLKLKKLTLPLLLFITLMPTLTWANVELMVWQNDEDAPRIIIPKLTNETFQQAVNRYVNHINQNEDLSSLLTSTVINNNIYNAYTIPVESQSRRRPRLAFIANKFEDMKYDGERIQRNIIQFDERGADSYVIALSADIGLKDHDANTYRELVVYTFNILVALGGDDIAEELSGRQRITNSKTVYTRDISELLLVKKFKEMALGIFFGICRGHQMGGIADGHVVVQDLTRSGVGVTHEHIRKDGSNSTEMQTWHHIYIDSQSLVARLLNLHRNTTVVLVENYYTMMVNSIHHQVVAALEKATSTVIAKHETSGVEALEQRNRLGVSTQFHSEFPKQISGNEEFSTMGGTLIRNLIAYARMMQNRLRTPVTACELYF